METTKTTIKGRWNKLDQERQAVLRRARQCAKLTIPSLLPPESATEHTTLETPYQGIGARGVNNLASKLLITLIPPNSPFFRLKIDDFSLEKLGQPDARAEVEKALNRIERAVMDEVETRALRVKMFNALRELITLGDTLLYLPDEGGMKVYRLDQYVVKRDPMGKPLEIIIREMVYPEDLPEEVITQVKPEDRKNPDEKVDIYTRIKREDSHWKVTQEAFDILIDSSEGTYPIDKCPWIPLRWNAIDGEDYGRGHVEEYLGDLMTVEALTKAILEGAIAAARVITLVKPNGTTRPRKLQEARNLDIIDGDADDVSVLQLEKYNDFRVASETLERLEARISYAFLLLQSVQRDAERVTAEEIRQMAKELEDSLGGVYSVLSQELQLPLVERLMYLMERGNRLPQLPKDIVRPAIVTGLEALGRGNDLTRLQILRDNIQPLGEQAMMYLNIGDFITRTGTALGIDTNGLVRTEEEVMQMMQAQQMAAMAQDSLPGVAQEITKGMIEDGRGQGPQS